MSDEIIAAICGAAAGALMGGVVGFCVNEIHESRRRRVTLRDQLIDHTFDLNARVSSYWSSDGRDLQAEAMILADFNKVQSRLASLGVSMEPGSLPRLLVKEIHQFATGAAFATNGRVADPMRAREVSSRVEKLVAQVRA